MNFFVFSGEASPNVVTDTSFELFDQSCESLAEGEESSSNLEILSSTGDEPSLLLYLLWLSTEL